MKRVLLSVVLALGLLAALPLPALAFTQRTGQSVTVDETIADDLYIFGADIEVSGDVNGDVVAFGQNIRVIGDVTGDVIAAGQLVTVSGDVDGAVRAAGQTVAVEGAVGDDVVAAGSSVRIAQESAVGRDAVVAGSNVTIDADVEGDVLGGADRFVLGGSVGGNVTADVSRFVIESGSTVSGDVTYYSDREADVNGQVAGEVQRLEPRVERHGRREPDPFTSGFFIVLGWVRWVVGMALLTVIALLIARRIAEYAAWEAWYGRPVLAGALGFALLVMAFPVAGIVLLLGLLIGGWWLSLAWLAFVFLVMLFGWAVAALALGNAIIGGIAHRRPHPMLAALLGVLVLGVVGPIPLIGWLVLFLALIVGTGATLLALWMPQRATQTPAAAPAQTAPPQYDI